MAAYNSLDFAEITAKLPGGGREKSAVGAPLPEGSIPSITFLE